MNILCLYNQTQTYTNTVFEHIDAFQQYSKNRWFYSHIDACSELSVNLTRFDAITIHYTIRLPFDQIPEKVAEPLSRYQGLKILFIQDEYDNTHRTWYWIKRLGIQLVFTVVPTANIDHIYPPKEFPEVRFVSNLTGYIPEKLPPEPACPPSERPLIVGYRGRPLPIRYGALGMEKVEVGRMVKHYCEMKEINHDIAWTEQKRIYGPQWYDFVRSCRSMLGSESGSNVFDWDGTLDSRITGFKETNPDLSENDAYHAVIEQMEIPGVMNQISPRAFEAIALRTVLALFEGDYSGVLTPNVHFIPIKKDGSNLEETFSLLNDGNYVDEMADRAYQDIILSGRYSYRSFIKMIDSHVDAMGVLTFNAIAGSAKAGVPGLHAPTTITTCPIRAPAPHLQQVVPVLEKVALGIWSNLPSGARGVLKPIIKKLLRKG